MKDWKTILLEQIIRENLSEQIKVTVVTKSIAIGSDATLTQFNASDKAWIAALPEKGKNEKYNRVYVKIKSNVTGTTTPGSVPATERIKKIKDFLDDNTVKTALTKVDKDWIWIISNPETSRFKSAGSPDDPDNPGAQVFMIAGMRKADINNFDTGLNNITPAHGKLANGNLVYSEAQIADLKTLSSKSKPTSDPDTTIILDKSAIAGKLTDIRELQKYLYAYFNKNKSILPEFMKSFLNEFIQENYNVTTGEWKGVLNHKTRELADHFATATADEHTFNYPGVNQLVSIDETFYKNLADSYAPLQLESKVIQYNTLLTEADFTKLKPIETKEDENGNLVKVTVTEPEEKKKVTPVVQGGDGKKKTEPGKKDITPVTEKDGLLDPQFVKPILDGIYIKNAFPDPNQIYLSYDRKHYIRRINAWEGVFKYPGPWKTDKGNIVKDLKGGRCAFGLHFIDVNDVTSQFVLYYTIGLKGVKGTGLKDYGQCISYPVLLNTQIIAYKVSNYFLKPQLFNAKLGTTPGVQSWAEGYFTGKIKPKSSFSPDHIKIGRTLDPNNYKYDKLSLAQKIVGRLYYSNDDAHLLATIKMIKNQDTMKRVVDLMRLIAKSAGNKTRFIIPLMKSESWLNTNFGGEDTSNWQYILEEAGYGSVDWDGKQWLTIYDLEDDSHYFNAGPFYEDVYNGRKIVVSGIGQVPQNPFCQLIEEAMGGSERRVVYDYFSNPTNRDIFGVREAGGYIIGANNFLLRKEK